MNIGNVPPILPVPKPPGRHHAVGAFGPGDKMKHGQHMHVQVTGYTSTVVLIVAPSEKAQGVPGPFWSISQIGVPVYRFWGGVRWNGVLPGPQGTVPVNLGFSEVDFADVPRIDQFFCFRVYD